MTPRNVLTPLVALDFLLAILALGTEAALQRFLPLALRGEAVGAWLAPGGTVVPSAALFVAWAVSAGLFVLAWVGLLQFWRRAREVYLLAWGLTLVVLGFSGPSILSPVGAVLDTAGTLVSGTLIGLVWFSDLTLRYGEAARPSMPLR